MENIVALHAVAKKHNLFFHMDGARIWNASVATGISLETYGSYPDTMSVCFSKGLGAPAGSMILGSKAFIEKAFRIRKSWGGGMRQIGILAAAALYALRNNIERLKEDHEKAQMLTNFLSAHPHIDLQPENVQTNIVIFTPKKKTVDEIIEACKAKGLLLSTGTATSLRAITHLDVSFEQISRACKILEEVLE
jgi:threonine aldolase